MDTKKIVMSQKVIDAINEELEYQSRLTAMGRADGDDHGVAGQLATLQAYTTKAINAWVENAGEEEALDVLRKVAAIAIRALEKYGCPTRSMTK